MAGLQAGHACFDCWDVRQAIIKFLWPSPTCLDNGISRACRLWAVVGNQRMMRLRREYVKNTIEFDSDKIQASETGQVEVSANELYPELLDLADIM